jgi:hypothetical protein
MYWMRGTTGRSAFAAIAMTTLFAAVIAGVFARGALAGKYHVYSCRMPNGQVAPVDGWSGSTAGAATYVEDKCEKGGALVAGLGAGAAHPVGTDIATWTLSPPAGETLSKATLWRAGDAEGGAVANATYEFWLAGPTQPEAFDSCVYVSGCMKTVGEPEMPLSISNVVAVSPANLGEHLYVNASCGGLQSYKCPSGKGDPNGYAAVIYLYAADLTLQQTSQPTVSDVQGELATSTSLGGTADLSLHAEDSGSGVYQAVFTVDGLEVGRTLLDENGGRCHDVGQTDDGLPAFLYLQPCPSSLTADLPLDTTTLSDGTHHLLVSITDAAGNSVVALDRKISVLNHPQAITPESPTPVQSPATTNQNDPSSPNPTPSLLVGAPGATTPPQSANGTNGSAFATLRVRWATTTKATLTGRYGRAQTILGRLATPAGTPVAGALLQVLDTPSYERAPTRALSSVRTDADGNFRLQLPAATPSGRITFAYSNRSGQPLPDVTASLSLTVPANLVLSVAPRTTHVGGTIVFNGTLRGAPLPPGGKQIVLEARSLGGSWRQFHVLSTGTHGRYRASYRFGLAGPISYQFRALSPHEADFPYGAGSSNVVLVRER